MKILQKLIFLSAFLILLASCDKDEIDSPNISDNQQSADFIFNESDLFRLLGIDARENSLSSQARSGASQSLVYTLSNESSGNKVIAFRGSSDGTLYESGRYDTGGTGTDGGLGNQGALTISRSGKLLFAINAGSNELSAFYIRPSGDLYLIDNVPSGGELPISVTTHHGLVYVLNAGGEGNITGFAFNKAGELSELPGSTRSLSSGASGPAQVSFSPNGQSLIVTEKATNIISSFAIDNKGLPGSINTLSSAGNTPFGFAFGNGNVFYVSEAAGGAANASTVSSYTVSNSGVVTLLDGPFPTNGSAACWVAVSQNGRLLFATNTAGDDITSLSASGRGQLSLANDGNTTPAFDGPIDAVTDHRSSYLYTLTGGNDYLITYRIGNNGSLTQTDTETGLPSGTTGLVVR